MLDFAKIAKVAERCKDVIPVAVQHADTGEVILVAYTNAVAFRKTLEHAAAERPLVERDQQGPRGHQAGRAQAFLADDADPHSTPRRLRLSARMAPRGR